MRSVEELSKECRALACMQCGVCSGGCPVSTKSKLNIRRVVGWLTLRGWKFRIDGDELWDCTTCYVCGYRCPRGVRLPELVISLRGLLVEEGRVPSTLARALENVYKHGNPWGRSRAKRGDWAQGLGVKTLSEVKEADVLLFTCCASAYDERGQLVAKALVKVLKALGEDLAILGEEEVCCGNEVYNLGELGLFDELMRHNLESLSRYSMGLVVTISPHCYHALRNRYRGIRAEVKHYTQFLCELLDGGKLKIDSKIEGVATYHDPCYLGRYNKVYEEPRKLLEGLFRKGVVEMDRSYGRSLCCEGGGGRMWYEGPPGRRLSEDRVREGLSTGAQIMAVACPFCLVNLEDAIKVVGVEEKLKVVDIAELVSKCLSH